MNLISGLWRDAVPNRLTEYRTTHNIWKYNVDTHYILCYSIIELSFMHSTLCRRSFVLAKYREQSFETIDLENIERHQKPGMDFWCLFLLSKIQNLGKGSKYKRKEKRDNSKKIEVCRMRNMEQEKKGGHA